MATTRLAEFQRDFAAALRLDDAALGTSPLASQPGFAVYRNTVRLACIDALRANYPTVLQLVGEPWFGDAASRFVANRMPRDGRLAHYGEGFAEFIAAFEPARELVYLAGVAQLDRCWTEAHLATDAPVLTVATVGALPAERLADARFVPHPAARWATFASMPVFTIWRRHREAIALDDELPWLGERALIVRPADAVAWHAIGPSAAAFLAASADGATFAVALEAAERADRAAESASEAALASWLPSLIHAGAFTRVESGP